MKWISTLNHSDLESMRRAVSAAEEDKQKNANFNGEDYEINYLKNVINYLEMGVVNDYLSDLEENE